VLNGHINAVHKQNKTASRKAAKPQSRNMQPQYQ
jgi:hypothetical protein